MKTLKVVDVSRSEGNLYEKMGEGEKIVVFDCSVSVLASDGKVYVHKTFVVKGAYKEDGCWYPNYDYKNEVEAFAAKIRARGVINLAYWDELVSPSFEENEAYNLKCEEEERMGWS